MKNKKSVTKKVIVSKIHKKLGEALNRRLLTDAVSVICLTLQENLLQDQAVSVENLGTFSPYVFHGHAGVNISTGQLQQVKPFRTVKFHPHFVFLELLASRREGFLKRNDMGRTRQRKD